MPKSISSSVYTLGMRQEMQSFNNQQLAVFFLTSYSLNITSILQLIFIYTCVFYFLNNYIEYNFRDITNLQTNFKLSCILKVSNFFNTLFY